MYVKYVIDPLGVDRAPLARIIHPTRENNTKHSFIPLLKTFIYFLNKFQLQKKAVVFLINPYNKKEEVDDEV